MGSNISTIQTIVHKKVPSKLLELSLEKLKSFYAIFKTSCESFWIDYSEFATVFDEKREIFDLWDINDSCLVNALEVFGGLIVFCETKFEAKIKLAFEIFDFNDLKSFALTDIEFIVTSCLTSVMRICQCHDAPQQSDIHQLISRYFREDSRVNLSQFINFCQYSQDFLDFFKFLGRDYPQKQEYLPAENVYSREKAESLILPYLLDANARSKDGLPYKAFEHSHGGEITSGRDIRNRNRIIKEKARFFKLEQEKTRFIKNTRLSLNWVYGFRCNDSIKSFVYHSDLQADFESTNFQQKIIYFVSNVVILYYYKQNKQRHYLEHRNEVNAIAISANKTFCATGEKGRSAMINIWDINTLKTKHTIYSEYRSDIYLLEFVREDKYLVTVCKYATSPIIIYEIESGDTVMSCYFDNFIIDMVPIANLSSSLNENFHDYATTHPLVENLFVCYSKTESHMFDFDISSKQFCRTQIINESLFPDNEITKCCPIYVTKDNYFDDGNVKEKNFGVVLYVALDNGNLFSIAEQANSKSQKFLVYDFKRYINEMIVFKHKLLCVITKNGVFYILDLITQKLIQEFELTQLNVRLDSFNIKNLVAGDDNKVFLSTWEGDLVSISLKSKTVWQQYTFHNHRKCSRFESISNMPSQLNAICIVKVPDSNDNIMYVAGESCTIYTYSTSTHELLETWKVKFPVTSIAGCVSSEGSIIITVGMLNGTLVFFIDHQEEFSHAAFQTPVHTLKFSKNCEHIFAATSDSFFYIYSANLEGVRNLYTATKLEFPDKQIPSSINFSENSEYVIFQSHTKNFYGYVYENRKWVLTVNITSLMFKNIALKLQVLQRELSIDKRSIPLIMDKKSGLIFVGNNEGFISVFDSIEAVSRNYETTYYGHSSAIVDLDFDSKNSLLYSAGKNDNSVFEWRLIYDIGMPTTVEHNILTDNLAHPDLIKRSMIANQISKVKTEYLEESLGYFGGYTSDEIRNILDLQSDTPESKANSNFLYPTCAIQLQHVYSIQTVEVRNNFGYIHCPKDKSHVRTLQNSATKMNSYQKNETLIVVSNNKISTSAYKKGISSANNNINSNLKTQKLLSKPTLAYETPIKSHTNLGAYSNQRNSNDKLTDTLHEEILTLNHINEKAIYKDDETLFCPADLNSFYYYFGRCEKHGEKCSRKIVYFISRLAIVVDPNHRDRQRFYEAHTSKISAVAIHPFKNLVATGEKAYLPKIHIWNPLTLQNKMICDTHHRQGIILLRFSIDQNYLLSISVEIAKASDDDLNISSTEDFATSIQISDSRTGKTVAFRNAFIQKIINAEFDYLNDDHFITSTSLQIDYWQILSGSIIHVSRVQIPFEKLPMCITNVYFINKLAFGKIEKQVLVSTSDGRIGFIMNNTFITPKHMKLNNTISAMKIFLYEGETLILLAFSDCTLAIYNLAFLKIDSVKYMNKSRKKQSYEVQSLDIYIKGNHLICLIGNTEGHLIEVTLLFESRVNGNEMRVISESEIYRGHTPALYSLTPSFTKGCIDKQISFCVTDKNIMVTVGVDQMLYIWDISKRIRIRQIELPNQATCVKFPPNSKYLAIGLIDGTVICYPFSSEGKLDKESFFKLECKTLTDEKYDCMPSVINIEFSKDNNYIAVSYANTKKEFEDDGLRYKSLSENSVIKIFSSKDASKTENDNSKSNPYNYFITLVPTTKLSFTSTVHEDCGLSCYYMAFSEDSLYLIAYYQKVRNRLHCRKVNDTNGKYIVYLLSKNPAEKYEKVMFVGSRPIKLNPFSFPSHINGKRFLGSIKSSPDYSENTMQAKAFQNLNNDRIIISYASCNDQMAALGSQTGEIYLSKKIILNTDIDNTDSYKKFKLHQAKRFPAHTSFVNQIEFCKVNNDRHLFTSGIDDECIFQWKITYIETKTELNQSASIQMEEKYNIYEIENDKVFKEFMREICPNRKRISEILLLKDTSVYPKFKLRLNGIIGRKAYTRRSNMLMISDDQLIYSTGTALVLLNFEIRKGHIEARVQINPSFHLSESLRSAQAKGDNPTEFSNLISQLDNDGNQVDRFIVNNTNYRAKKQMVNSSFKKKKTKTPSNIQSRKTRLILGRSENFNSQRFLFPNVNSQIKATSEIMCFELAPDMKTLCIATKDEYSNILVWEICCQTFLGSLVLEQCISPIVIRCSYDSQFLACCGITRDYTMGFYFCNIKKFEVLAMLNLKHSVQDKIFDLAFLPKKNDEFMTVGFLHCSKWNYKAGILEFREIKLQSLDKKNHVNDYYHESKQEDVNNLFLVIKFLTPERFILTDSIGYIYVCDFEKIHQKYQCLVDVPITTISLLESDPTTTFAAGGFDNFLYIFKICPKNMKNLHINIIGKIEIVYKNFGETLKHDENKHKKEIQVQSLLFPDNQRAIIGTRDGSIYLLEFDQNNLSDETFCKYCDNHKYKYDSSSGHKSNSQGLPIVANEIIRFWDHHQPKVADFSSDSKFLFFISTTGYFIVYNLERMSNKFCYDFEESVQNMYVNTTNIFLIFHKSISMMSIESVVNDDEELQKATSITNRGNADIYSKNRSENLITFDQSETIEDSCVSKSKCYLAVVLSKIEPSDQTSLSILIFRVISIADFNPNSKTPSMQEPIEKFDMKKSLKLLHTLKIDSYDFFDFSIDEKYFMYKNKQDKKFVFCFDKTSFSFMGDKFDTIIEWQSIGIKTMDAYKIIESNFTSDNPLTSIVRLGDDTILTTDRIGTVKLLDPHL